MPANSQREQAIKNVMSMFDITREQAITFLDGTTRSIEELVINGTGDPTKTPEGLIKADDPAECVNITPAMRPRTAAWFTSRPSRRKMN